MRSRPLRWVLWAMGVVMLVWSSPLGLFDPVTLALVLDPELLVLMLAVAIMMVRVDLLTFLRSIAQRAPQTPVPARGVSGPPVPRRAVVRQALGSFGVRRHRS